MTDDKFKISLRENGEHSFIRGLECYTEYQRTQDQMLLKDAIMFLHHGIELLMQTEKRAKRLNIMVTGASELEELKRIIE